MPLQIAGTETCGLQGCFKGVKHTYVEVEMYSLDSYFEKFVKSKGPINVLAIDTEGWDFDVLFGASSVLDRTYYLEFEYHVIGIRGCSPKLPPRIFGIEREHTSQGWRGEVRRIQSENGKFWQRLISAR